MSEQFPDSSHESADKAPLRKVQLTKSEWHDLHMAADPENDLAAQIVMTEHGLSFDEGDIEISVYDADNDQYQDFVATTDSVDPFTRRRVDNEAVAAAGEPNEYDDMLRTDVELNEANGYSVENAAVVTPESEKNLELKTDYAVNRLEAAGRADPQLLNVIADALKDMPGGLPKDARTLVEVLRRHESAATLVTAYFRDKADAYQSDLPDRVRSNMSKKPGFPGGEVMNSLDVAAMYAWRKISGQWDPSREDGSTDDKRTVGQHREAADQILLAPSISWRSYRER
jgi:hypothetical protein